MIECGCSKAGCGARLYVQDDGITMTWPTREPSRPDLGEHQMYANDEALKQLVRDAMAVLRKRAEARIYADLNIGGL